MMKRTPITDIDEIKRRIDNGDLDDSEIKFAMDGANFTNFIVSYAELHGFNINVAITGSINVPLYYANALMESGNAEDAFAIVDGMIESLGHAKRMLTDKMNTQTDADAVRFKT